MRHRNASFEQCATVAIAQMNAVSRDRTLLQKSVSINQFDGRATETLANLALLVVSFGQMDRNGQTILLAQLSRTVHILLRATIRSVGSDHYRQAIALFGLRHRCGQVLLECRHTVVNKAGRQHRADTQFLSRISHRLLIPIHIDKGRHATAQHLDNTQLGTQLHIVAVDQRLVGPDVVVQPLHQLNIVGIASHQCHRHVAMGVDQTRHQQFASSVHLAQVATARLTEARNLVCVARDHRDAIALHTHRRLEILLLVGKRRRHWQNGYVIEQQIHSSSIFSCQSNYPSPLRSYVCRPYW